MAPYRENCFLTTLPTFMEYKNLNYAVEKIVGHKKTPEEILYRGHWYRKNSKNDTYELESHIPAHFVTHCWQLNATKLSHNATRRGCRVDWWGSRECSHCLTRHIYILQRRRSRQTQLTILPRTRPSTASRFVVAVKLISFGCFLAENWAFLKISYKKTVKLAVMPAVSRSV